MPQALTLSFSKLAILTMVCEGFNNKEIAAKFSLSKRTIDCHMQELLKVTGFNNRTQLAVWATASGIVPVPKLPEIALTVRASL